MIRLSNIFSLACVVAFATGCAEKKPPVQPLVQPTAKPTTQPATKQQPVAQAIRLNDEPTTEPNSPSSNATDPIASMEPERFLLLARGGPLIVDVLLTIDGQSFGKPIESLVDRVLQAADTNGDGRATWDEWRQNEEFLRGDLAKLDPIRKRTVNNWVERYDENSDGRLQRAEAAAWLGRDAGRSVSGLRMRSSRTYGGMNATESRLWQVLDEDRNGQLHGEELAATSRRLFALDTDDNRIVDATELATLREQLDAQRPMRTSYQRTARRDSAVRLSKTSDASELDYLLSDLYAPRQQLGPTSFSARPKLFATLDVDGDQSLDGQELAALLTVEPHVTLAVEFDSASSAAKLTLLEHADEIGAMESTSDDRIILVTAESRFTFSARDMRTSGGEQQVLNANEISLMIHDRADALFETLDTNADGRLGEREIVEAADRISTLRAEGGEQLRPSDLPYSMTIVFARGEPRGERSFSVPRTTAGTDYDQTTPTWYRHADLNADGDVSRREFLGDDAQFEVLDVDGDGFVSAAEALGEAAATQ